MLKLLRFLKPYRRQIAICYLLTLVQLAAELLLPALMTAIVNDGIAAKNTAEVWRIGVIMAAAALLIVTVAIIVRRKINYVSTYFAYDLRNIIFKKINSLTAEQFNSVGNASLQARATGDLHWMAEVVNWLFMLASVPVLFIGGIIMAFSVNVKLSAVALLAAPAVLVVLLIMSRLVRPFIKAANLHMDKSILIMRERLIGIRVIRAFNKEEHEHSRFARQVAVMSKNFIRNNSVSGALGPTMTLLTNAAILAVLYAASVFITDPSQLLDAGGITAVVQYVNIIMSAVVSVSFFVVMLPHVTESGRRINEVLNIPEKDESGTVLPDKLSGEIKIENATFYFDKKSSEPVLSGVNMEFHPRTTVAVIGGTGSGKSTLAKLLLRFYSLTEGVISFDGVNADTVDAQYLRGCLSYVPQRAALFRGTLKSNILLGNLSSTDEEIEKAVRVAQLKDFTESKTDGLNYEVLESGKNLSGGQKQRLSIARALVRNCNILIFDDSFSALDYATDLKLRTALNAEYADKLKIIITQRVATAVNADNIYVLDKGRVVGAGTHAELLNSCEVYKKLAKLQMNIGEEV